VSQINAKQKFAPQRSGMTHQRWVEVSRIQMPRNLVHISKTFDYVTDPRTLIDKITRPDVLRMHKGVTFNQGRNWHKRELRIKRQQAT